MSLFFKRKKRNHKKNVEQTIIPVFDISPFGYDTVFCDDMVMSMNCRETHRNNNVLVVGSSGSGKTYMSKKEQKNYVVPNILQAVGNYVIADPDGKLLHDYGKFLENNGYKVQTLNLKDMSHSARYNPFRYIHNIEHIDALIDILIEGTNPDASNTPDLFWSIAEKKFFKFIIFYLWMYADEKDQTLAKVNEMIVMARPEANTGRSKLDDLFDKLEKKEPGSIVVAEYRKFQAAVSSNKALMGVIVSAAIRMAMFGIPDIEQLTSNDDLHLEEFGDSKHALFVVTSSVDKTYHFLASMLYSQLFTELYSCVEKQATHSWLLKLPNRDVVHVEHAHNAKESDKAKIRMDEFAKKLKNVHIRENKERKYFEIVTEDDIVLSWRGEESEAKEYIASLKDAKIEKGEFGLPIHVRMIL